MMEEREEERGGAITPLTPPEPAKTPILQSIEAPNTLHKFL